MTSYIRYIMDVDARDIGTNVQYLHEICQKIDDQSARESCEASAEMFLGIPYVASRCEATTALSYLQSAVKEISHTIDTLPPTQERDEITRQANILNNQVRRYIIKMLKERCKCEIR